MKVYVSEVNEGSLSWNKVEVYRKVFFGLLCSTIRTEYLSFEARYLMIKYFNTDTEVTISDEPLEVPHLRVTCNVSLGRRDWEMYLVGPKGEIPLAEQGPGVCLQSLLDIFNIEKPVALPYGYTGKFTFYFSGKGLDTYINQW